MHNVPNYPTTVQWRAPDSLLFQWKTRESLDFHRFNWEKERNRLLSKSTRGKKILDQLSGTLIFPSFEISRLFSHLFSREKRAGNFKERNGHLNDQLVKKWCFVCNRFGMEKGKSFSQNYFLTISCTKRIILNCNVLTFNSSNITKYR